MEHLRAEVGQFRHLAVGQRVERADARHDPRIGGHDAVDIRVDPHLVRAQRSADDRPGIVAAAPPQRRDNALRRAADEPGNHWHRARLEQGAQHRLDLACGDCHLGDSGLKSRVGPDDRRGVDRHRRMPARAKSGREQVDAHALAQRRHRVQRPRRGFPEHGERIAEQDELVESRSYRGQHVAALGLGEVQLARSLFMFALNRGRQLANVAPTARDRRRCAVQQRVRDAAHRRNDDGDLVPFTVECADDVRGLRNCRGTAHRRSAELDDESLSHS